MIFASAQNDENDDNLLCSLNRFRRWWHIKPRKKSRSIKVLRPIEKWNKTREDQNSPSNCSHALKFSFGGIKSGRVGGVDGDALVDVVVVVAFSPLNCSTAMEIIFLITLPSSGNAVKRCCCCCLVDAVVAPIDFVGITFPLIDFMQLLLLLLLTAQQYDEFTSIAASVGTCTQREKKKEKMTEDLERKKRVQNVFQLLRFDLPLKPTFGDKSLNSNLRTRATLNRPWSKASLPKIGVDVTKWLGFRNSAGVTDIFRCFAGLSMSSINELWPHKSPPKAAAAPARSILTQLLFDRHNFGNESRLDNRRRKPCNGRARRKSWIGEMYGGGHSLSSLRESEPSDAESDEFEWPIRDL